MDCLDQTLFNWMAAIILANTLSLGTLIAIIVMGYARPKKGICPICKNRPNSEADHKKDDV